MVEGPSDEALLGEYLKQKYKNQYIKFDIKHGDVFYNQKTNKESIKNTIGNSIKSIIKKQKYKQSDILAVMHILDTDGCFIDDEYIEINENQQSKTWYNSDSISVNSEKQKENISHRNKKRSINIRTMNSIDSVVGKQYYYQLYYFSRTMEHVIFNEPNPQNETKYTNIEEFIISLKISLENYLSDFSPIITARPYSNKYKESWQFIEQKTNSLKRYANVPLLFQAIDTKVSEIQ